MQAGQELFQPLQVDAVFVRLLIQRYRSFRIGCGTAQTFFCSHQLAEYVGEVSGRDGRAVFSFWEQTKQCAS
jgi:hypothetical protein